MEQLFTNQRMSQWIMFVSFLLVKPHQEQELVSKGGSVISNSDCMLYVRSHRTSVRCSVRSKNKADFFIKYRLALPSFQYHEDVFRRTEPVSFIKWSGFNGTL